MVTSLLAVSVRVVFGFDKEQTREFDSSSFRDVRFLSWRVITQSLHRRRLNPLFLRTFDPPSTIRRIRVYATLAGMVQWALVFSKTVEITFAVILSEHCLSERQTDSHPLDRQPCRLILRQNIFLFFPSFEPTE